MQSNRHAQLLLGHLKALRKIVFLSVSRKSLHYIAYCVCEECLQGFRPATLCDFALIHHAGPRTQCQGGAAEVRGFLLCVCDVLSIACLQAGGSDLIIMLHYVEMCCQPWLRFLDSGKPGYTNISAQ